MNKSEWENKSLVYIILLAYVLNLLFGWVGFFLEQGCSEQVLLYQIGNAFAISGSVMAGRYTGIRGQHVAASAYILLGITHGISLAALGKAGINVEREATMAMPMIPALIFMFWCSLYPFWVRVLSLIPSVCFGLVYMDVHLGDTRLGWSLYVGYAILQIVEVIWGWFLLKDWKHQNIQNQP